MDVKSRCSCEAQIIPWTILLSSSLLSSAPQNTAQLAVKETVLPGTWTTTEEELKDCNSYNWKIPLVGKHSLTQLTFSHLEVGGIDLT